MKKRTRKSQAKRTSKPAKKAAARSKPAKKAARKSRPPKQAARAVTPRSARPSGPPPRAEALEARPETRTAAAAPPVLATAQAAGKSRGPAAAPAAAPDTARLEAREKVVAARQALGEARRQPGLTPEQQDVLDRGYQELVDAEDTLAFEDLSGRVGALESAAASLGEVAKKIQKSIAGLKKVAEVVNTAAKVLGVLADIAAKAASSGIL